MWRWFGFVCATVAAAGGGAWFRRWRAFWYLAKFGAIDVNGALKFTYLQLEMWNILLKNARFAVSRLIIFQEIINWFCVFDLEGKLSAVVPRVKKLSAAKPDAVISFTFYRAHRAAAANHKSLWLVSVLDQGPDGKTPSKTSTKFSLYQDRSENRTYSSVSYSHMSAWKQAF